MTITEQIIAAHSDRKADSPGDVLFVRPDLAVGSEIIFPQALKFLKDLGAGKLMRQEHIAVINGHLVATKEAAVGTLVSALDKFATDNELKNYFQVGRSGACQTLLTSQQMIKPGSLIVGSDQHITTYGALGALATGVGGVDLASVWVTGTTWMRVPASARVRIEGEFSPMVTPKDLALYLIWKIGGEGAKDLSVEFTGGGLTQLDMRARFTIANLMVETGAKYAWFPIDQVTRAYFHEIGQESGLSPSYQQGDADYEMEVEIDLGEIEPMIAAPYSPVNGVPISKAENTEVNQVIIGTCTNGEIEDFRSITPLLEEHGVHPKVRLGLYPASHLTIRQMLDEGIGLRLTACGARISPPTCQACLGSGPSLIGDEETGVYTANRNYRGRHGPASAKVYLAGPMVAAASAIRGEITDPREL